MSNCFIFLDDFECVEGLSQHQKYLLKLVIYFVVLVFAQSIPHELGHLFLAKLLGFQVFGIHWNLFNPSFVSIGLVYNPVLFKLVLVAGGWSMSLFMYLVYRISHDVALRKIARVFILYGFLGGLFEALFTHLYTYVPVFSRLLFVFCITMIFAYDDLSRYFLHKGP